MDDRHDWQIIFAASKANDGVYDGDKLPEHYFPFPRGTWLERRLEKIRKEQGDETNE